ncbi:MAG: gluconeogenesis factor YvcK family protein, partial [Pseudanabaenaceae cyanobacterium bins.68]|nr:gluconeogenesis factor YvcK family protein [Pseudanabaenaceae cyanobacterium bins.68]
ELFQYRFTSGAGLEGHSFGNLFLTAMAEITGDLEQAIAASSQVLAVRGRVLPATLSDIVLWAELEDGRYIEGESNITAANGVIIDIGCKPADPPPLPRVIQEIQEAELIVIGPGSLYTSIIPNLLVPEITRALAQRQAPCVYVCNIMSQPGETQNYSVADHVEALDNVLGVRVCDVVLAQNHPPSAKALEHYAKHQAAQFVEFDPQRLAQINCPFLLADVMEEQADGKVRHHSDKLAGVLNHWYNHR